MADPTIHFVISTPRSGSTWLCHGLNCHPQVFATEHRLFGNFCDMWPNNNGTLQPRLTFDSYAKAFSVHYFHDQLDLDRWQFVDEFQRAFAEFVCQFARQRSGKPVIVDKVTPYPGTTQLVIRQIRKFFPESKIIHLIRDGRDVATSGVFDWLLKDAAGTERYQFFVQRDSDMTLTRFFDDDALTKWAAHWSETNRVIADAAASLQVNYEAMSINQGVELQKVFRTLSVNDSKKISQNAANYASFQNLTGRMPGRAIATAKARKGIVGDWKNYFTQKDGEIFQQIAEREIIQFGYAKDARWIEQLPKKLCLSNSELPIV